MTQKEQVKIRKLVGKICDTCMRINQETERAAFCWINGHVSLLSVCVAVSKADYNNDIVKWEENYGEKEWTTTKEIIAKLTDRLAALEKFLADELAK